MSSNQSDRAQTNPSLEQSLEIIEQVGDQLSDPSISDRASSLYIDFSEEGAIVGRSGKEVAAACLFISIRQHEVPITVDELAEHLNEVGVAVSPDDIISTYRSLSGVLDIEVPVLTPHAFLPQISTEVDLPVPIVQRAEEILDAADDAQVTVGKQPSAAAAAAVYLAAQYEDTPITQKETAAAGGVSTLTIRNHAREFDQHYDSDDPSPLGDSETGKFG